MDARLRRRPVTVDDLDALVALREASDLAVLGRPDTTRADLAADLRAERLQHHGWYDERGELVGHGWLGAAGGSAQVQLDLCLRPGTDVELGTRLLEQLEGWAVALIAELGHDHAVLEAYSHRQDARARDWYGGAASTP